MPIPKYIMMRKSNKKPDDFFRSHPVFYENTYVWVLNRQRFQCIQKFVFDGFLVFDRLAEWNVNQLVVLYADHDVPLIFEQGVDGSFPHSAREDTVGSSR